MWPEVRLLLGVPHFWAICLTLWTVGPDHFDPDLYFTDTCRNGIGRF